MLGNDCVWVCISHSFTCLGLNPLTSAPDSLASGFPFLLTNFPSNQRAPSNCMPLEWRLLLLAALTSFHLNSNLSLGKLNLMSPLRATLINWVCFFSFLLFDVPPSGLLFWIFITLALFSLLLSLFSFCFLHSSHWRQWAVQRPELPSPLPARQPPSNSNLRSGP